MTTLEELVPETDPGDDRARSRLWRRRRPAPRAHPFWRFVFPLLVVAAGVAVFALWREGTKSVLDSTDGRVLEVVVDPSQPGYEAFVDPTSTLLIVHTSGGDLVGVTVLAQTALEMGGSGVLLTSDLLVAHEDPAGTEVTEFLSAAWDDGGLERVELLVERLFGFGFIEAVELTEADLARALAPVEPLPYLLADELVTEDSDGLTRVWMTTGRKELSGEDAARLYGFRNPGEADANRVLRQLVLWESWLETIGRSADPEASVPEGDAGLAPYLRSLGRGASDMVVLPVQPIGEAETSPFYVLSDDTRSTWLPERALKMVPLPVSPVSAVRPTVRLLDGTGDAAVRDRVSLEVVAAGGVISVIGNAESFGVDETIVTYHRPEISARAEEIASSLGVEAAFVDDVEQPTDLTVTIGLDQVEP